MVGPALSTADEFTWTVRNVAPAVAVEAPDADGFEGTTLRTGGRFSDVPADDLTIRQVSGPGTVTDNGDGTWTWSYNGADDLTGQVVVRATDDDNATQDDTFAVTVTNRAPVVTPGTQPATGHEGNTLTTNGSFTDVPADTMTLSHTGGGTLEVARDANGKATGAWTWRLATTDQTSGTVTVTATDEDRGTSSNTFSYEATNAAPQVAVDAQNATGNEGDTLSRTGKFTDVPGDNVQLSHTGGGTLSLNTDGSWTWSLATTDQISGPVTVTARDKDGETNTDTFNFSAVNVAPRQTTEPSNASGSEGGTLTASGAFADVSGDTVSISKTDGAGSVIANADGSWTWSLPTTDNVSGTVTVTATDEDGGSTASTFSYGATNVAPTLSSLTVTGATGTACQTGNVVTVSFSVTDPGTADTMSGSINWGDNTTPTAFSERTVSSASHTYTGPGNYTITVNVSDNDNGAAALKTATVSRHYAVGAIQSPYNADGSSVFKYGSTAPVKVRITDCNSAAVPGLAPTIRVALASSLAPGASINETVDSTSSADTTGVMRYDSASGNYIYNLATKSLADGDAQYVVEVNNSNTKVQQKFGLRTK